MSPTANSRTEVANSSYSAANFASVFAVLSTFGAVIQSKIAEPEELDDVVQCTDGSQNLKDLALAVLAAATGRKSKAPLNAGQWPKLCSEVAGNTVFILKSLQVPEAVADSLDAFIEQSVAVRVDVLYWLCEAALMDNPAIKELVDREAEKMRKPTLASTAKDNFVRLQPLAEISKQRYWMFGSKTRQLYLESLSQRGRGKLELLAQTPDEFRSVAEEMHAQRSRAPKELADHIVEETVPFLEAQIRKRERVERALQRQALAMANVHIYETRTRKRQRVNYNVDDGLEVADF
ncbi:hypothetical protein H4R23_006273 [Coemansia sp. Cherry 401B]|nr:hypothetical protein IWW54_006368 [Coemansia sp. RSA 2705]KAJ2711897.1 hypothetical protein H4R23_006273 [Coemansia sp. Cherry 401B]